MLSCYCVLLWICGQRDVPRWRCVAQYVSTPTFYHHLTIPMISVSIINVAISRMCEVRVLCLSMSLGRIKWNRMVTGFESFRYQCTWALKQSLSATTIWYQVMTFSTPPVDKIYPARACDILWFNLLKSNGYVMHHQFNIQQLYALPTLYLCVLYLSENKQRLVPLTA